MDLPGRGLLRWARSGVLVGLTVLVSLGGHVLAGGPVHLSGPALLGVLALAAGCVAAADTRRGAGEIFPVLLLAQPVLHLLASMGSHHHAAGSIEAALGPGADVLPATAPTPLMVAAHVAAAGVLSVLLAAADRVLWALVSLRTRVRLPRPAPLPVASSRGLPAGGGEVCVPLRSALRCSPRLRRGPPVAVAAL